MLEEMIDRCRSVLGIRIVGFDSHSPWEIGGGLWLSWQRTYRGSSTTERQRWRGEVEDGGWRMEDFPQRRVGHRDRNVKLETAQTGCLHVYLYECQTSSNVYTRALNIDVFIPLIVQKSDFRSLTFA